MQTDEQYLKKVTENKELLKGLNVDQDSWDRAEKKELQLKLKECSHLLKDWNVSSVDHVVLSCARQFMDKIQALENEANMNMKITSSQKLLNRIEDATEFMKRTVKYNEDILNSEKVTSLSVALQNLSIESAGSASVLENEYSFLSYEQIKELIKKNKEQEAEIMKLSSLMNKL